MAIEKFLKKVKRRSSSKNINKRLYSNNDGTDFRRNFREKFYMLGSTKITSEMLEELARIMLAWVRHTPDLYIFEEFLNMQEIPRNTLIRWENKCKKLKDAKVLTIQIIAANREKASFLRAPDGIAFKHMQGTYSAKWKAQEQYFNDLKSSVAQKQSSGKQIIVVKDYKLEPNEAKS